MNRERTAVARRMDEAERLRAAIKQHRDDWSAAIGREVTTRQEMNRRKREANQKLWATLNKAPRHCGCSDPEYCERVNHWPVDPDYFAAKYEPVGGDG